MARKDEFLEWMENIGLKSTTARNYISSINEISKKCLQERKEESLFDITDIQFIDELSKKFEINGDYYKLGYERNGGIRASIFKYLYFLKNPNIKNKKVLPIRESEKIINNEAEIDKFGIINKAFRMILYPLAEFVGKTLREKDDKNWWKKYVIDKLQINAAGNLPKDGSYEDCKNRLDIQACLNIIEYNWMEIFKDFFIKKGGKYSQNKYFNWVKGLKIIRNDYDAHYTIQTLESFDDNDLVRELENIACFMEPINISVSKQIRSIKDSIH